MNVRNYFSSVLFVCIVICITAGILPAQNFLVTTDYNTCLNGLKDQSGNWVIPAKYETMYRTTGYCYIVSNGGKYGVVDTTGRETIPLQYEDVQLIPSPHYYTNRWNYFTVRLGFLRGVVDSANNVVVPIRYDVVYGYPDSTLVACSGKRNWDFYNLQGTCFPLHWKSNLAPRHLGPGCYAVANRKIFRRKYGMVDDSGHVLLKRKYTYLEGYRATQTVRVYKKNKHGLCSFAGRFIWPVVFSRPAHGPWYNAENIAVYGTGVAYYNGYFGLITATGDTILPFIYDHIYPFRDNRSTIFAPRMWVVERKGKSGIYESGKGWNIPMEYQDLITLAEYSCETDSSPVGLLLAQRNNLWGVITSEGEEILPFIYEEYHDPGAKDYILRKGDSLVCLSVGTMGMENTMLSQRAIPIRQVFQINDIAGISDIPASKTFAVYHGPNGCKIWYHPGHTQDSLHSGDSTYALTGKILPGFTVPDTIVRATVFSVQPVRCVPTLNSAISFASGRNMIDPDSSNGVRFCMITYPGTHVRRLANVSLQVNDSVHDYFITDIDDIIRDDGKVILSGDSIAAVQTVYNSQTGALCFYFYTFEKGACVIDPEGRVVVPFSQNNISFFTADYAWQANSRKYPQEWKLVDLKTGKNILGKKTTANEPSQIWKNVTVVEDDKHGVRLFNPYQRKYVSTFGANNIQPINEAGSLFVVKTCTGNMGVMDENGTWITDTLWNSFTPALYDTAAIYSQYEMQDDDALMFFRYYIFYNETGSTIVDAWQGTIASWNHVLPVLWNASCVVRDSLRELDHALRVYNSTYRPQKIYVQRADTASLHIWHRRCLIDSCFMPKRPYYGDFDLNYFPCDYCQKGNDAPMWAYRWTRNPITDAHFGISHAGDSMISFYRMYPHYSRGVASGKTWFSNVMLFPEGPRQMLLDSLFVPSGDWRNFIINQVITYVNSHTGVTGDCHNPQAFPVLLRERFLITADGLELYPEGFYERGHTLVILVPWKDADPYLRSDVRSKLPKVNQ